MTLRVGQKVARIRGGTWLSVEGIDHIAPDKLPAPGVVYVITSIEEDGPMTWLGLQGFPSEIGFDSRAFRPVVEGETDISIFKSLLTPKKVLEDA